MESVLYAVLSGIAATAALVMGCYDSLHELQTCYNVLSSHPESMSVVDENFPQAILDPSPTVFISALFIFSLATLSTYHLCRQHRFQNHFLVLGICTGVGFLIIRRFARVDRPPLEMEVREIFPLCIVVASIVSAVLHWSIGGPTIKNNSGGEHTIETKDHLSEEKLESLKMERKGKQEIVSNG
ncbi:MAG: hypothetical protein Q9212_003447 [Teloschistes hypoglaucus]